MARTKTKVPKFKNEAEEARWWDANRQRLDRELAAAMKAGTAKRLTQSELRQRVQGATRAVSLRLPEADIALAKQQAEKKGLPYQTYIKSLLHQALRRAG